MVDGAPGGGNVWGNERLLTACRVFSLAAAAAPTSACAGLTAARRGALRSKNQVGDAGAAVLADAVRGLEALEKLSLA